MLEKSLLSHHLNRCVGNEGEGDQSAALKQKNFLKSVISSVLFLFYTATVSAFLHLFFINV